MRKIESTNARKAQATVPSMQVHHKSTKVSLASLYGSVPALPNESADLEREIDEAMAEEAKRIVGRLARP